MNTVHQAKLKVIVPKAFSAIKLPSDSTRMIDWPYQLNRDFDQNIDQMPSHIGRVSGKKEYT